MRQSCIFSIITPVFRVTWSSEIIIICWFAAQETFLIIINVENIDIFDIATVMSFWFSLDSQSSESWSKLSYKTVIVNNISHQFIISSVSRRN